MFTTDRFFKMGSTHLVCQDYARTSVSNGAAAAVVADGCSSSPDTDVGARIVALEAMPLVELGNPMGQIETISSLFGCALRLLPSSMPQECLDTTLLTAQVKGGLINVAIWGDGFFAARREDGQIEVHRISFLDAHGEPSSHPIYPSYFALDKRICDIKEPIAGRLSRVLEHSPTRLIERRVVSIERGQVVPAEDVSRHREPVEEYPAYIWELPLGAYDLIALLSDGADSFYESTASKTWKSTTSLESIAVVGAMMGFKGVKGAFVQRRARRVLRDMEAADITHADDFSMAAIHIDFEEEP